MYTQRVNGQKRKVGVRYAIVTTLAVVLPIIGVQNGFAEGNGTGILNSPHDFSNTSWNITGEICVVCHAPHDRALAQQRYLNGLLWNHDVTQATFTMYDSSWSSSLKGAQSAQPDGIAKLCLGCHDGTIAVDSFDQYAATASSFIDVAYSANLIQAWIQTLMIRTQLPWVPAVP